MWTRFKVWQQFGGQWAKAGVYIKTKVHNMKHGGGVKAWKTLAQLEQHYHCPITAAAVCKQLTDSGKWRPNPDAPQCEAAIEYWAHLREDEAWRKTTETETVFAFEAELGPDALKLIDNDWLEIAADCFHDTSSSAAGPARAAAGQHSIDDIRAEARQAEREKIEAEQQERDLAMLEAKERAKDEKKRRREEEKTRPWLKPRSGQAVCRSTSPSLWASFLAWTTRQSWRSLCAQNGSQNSRPPKPLWRGSSRTWIAARKIMRWLLLLKQTRS